MILQATETMKEMVPMAVRLALSPHPKQVRLSMNRMRENKSILLLRMLYSAELISIGMPRIYAALNGTSVQNNVKNIHTPIPESIAVPNVFANVEKIC